MSLTIDELLSMYETEMERILNLKPTISKNDLIDEYFQFSGKYYGKILISSCFKKFYRENDTEKICNYVKPALEKFLIILMIHDDIGEEYDENNFFLNLLKDNIPCCLEHD